MSDLLDTVVGKALRLEAPGRGEAQAVLDLPDDDVLEVVAAAFRVRRRVLRPPVQMNFLVNLRSDPCPEGTYCSQRSDSSSEI